MGNSYTLCKKSLIPSMKFNKGSNVHCTKNTKNENILKKSIGKSYIQQKTKSFILGPSVYTSLGRYTVLLFQSKIQITQPTKLKLVIVNTLYLWLIMVKYAEGYCKEREGTSI